MTDYEHKKIIKSLGFKMPTSYDYWVHDSVKFALDLTYVGSMGFAYVCSTSLGEFLFAGTILTSTYVLGMEIHSYNDPRRRVRAAIAERKESLEKGTQSKYLTREEQLKNFIKWAEMDKGSALFLKDSFLYVDISKLH